MTDVHISLAARPSEEYEVPASRRTTWDPGVPGGIPNYTTVHSTLNASTYGNGSSDASSAINSAIASAGAAASAQAPQVVELSAGLFRADSLISLAEDYVVLRGDGMGSTTIRCGAARQNLAQLGRGADWGGEVNVVGSIAKGASSFTVAAGHGLEADDLIVLDQVDDSDVVLGDGTWWKRASGNSENGPTSQEGYRSRGQTIHVGNVNGNVITPSDSTIIHAAHPSGNTPQLFQSSNVPQGTRFSGFEDLTLTGWGDGNGYGYHGLTVHWSYGCWVKGVEFKGDGTYPTTGVDLKFDRSVRCEARENYLHHAAIYDTGGHAYGLTITRQSSDILVVDNEVFRKNKNITLEASGPGNVIAYNYVDDPVLDTPISTGWLEAGIDGSHLSHPMYDLFEGNHTSKMGAADTHGSAGQLVFFRNYATGRRTYSLTPGISHCAMWCARSMYYMTFVGNVLHDDPYGTAIYEPVIENTDDYTWASINLPKVRYLGWSDGEWQFGIDLNVEATLLMERNYDGVNADIDNDSGGDLPDSLFLDSKPAFFGANTWPWVDSEGQTRTYTLPAKARFDAR